MLQLATFLAVALASADAPGAADAGKPTIGRIESCNFSTQSLPPPFHPPKAFADGYKLFAASGAFIPESITVKSVILAGNTQLRLKPDETKQLYAGLDKVYAGIAVDPLFKNIHSALPYCLSEKRPARGHYFAYYPHKITDATRTLVFLHGYGGNFLFYTYVLKEEFPEAVILVPSWGPSWRDGTMQYLDDMFQDVKQRRGLSIAKPCLMAISAGGPAGFRLYNEHPDRFSGLVSLASSPSGAVVPTLKKELRILMVNGRQDSGFRIAGVQAVASRLAERLPHFQIHVLDGDHFFLLSKQEETFRVVRTFFDKEIGQKRD